MSATLKRVETPAEYRAVATRLEVLARAAPDLGVRRQLNESVRLLRELADALVQPQQRTTR